MIWEQLKKKPFNLDENALIWVRKTYEGMSVEEKIGQVFCPWVATEDVEDIHELTREKHIGGAILKELPKERAWEIQNELQCSAQIPLLLGANLETGGNGCASEGTYIGRQMAVAATGDARFAYELGRVSAVEAASVGINWSFAPVVDIDMNYRNPITNVRTYGDDAETVLKMASAYCDGCMGEGLAVAIKHFPGDGVDDRDQHLVTSVNTLSADAWRKSYGRIYKALINKGVMSVMSGHIALPAMEEEFSGETKIIPATCSKNLLVKLLREELGFNGLVTTDATTMIGYCSYMPRKEIIPYCIEQGCDVILISKDLDEDYHFMLEGYRQGILSDKRLEEATLRILAMKAALGLDKRKKPQKSGMSVIGCDVHMQIAKRCADAAVTLVKDTKNLLPLDPQKNRRVLLEMMGDKNPSATALWKSLLTKEGFEVTEYVPESMFEKPDGNSETFKAQFDLVLYVVLSDAASNNTTVRLNWHTVWGWGNNTPWFVKEVPTLMVSMGNPYHLLDAPMIQTYINAYCYSRQYAEAVMEKLMGRSGFKGVSPVDPFCGRMDTHM